MPLLSHPKHRVPKILEQLGVFSEPTRPQLSTRGLLFPKTGPWEACSTHLGPSSVVWEDPEVDINEARLNALLTSRRVTWFVLEPPQSNHALDQQLLFHFLVPQELPPQPGHSPFPLSFPDSEETKAVPTNPPSQSFGWNREGRRGRGPVDPEPREWLPWMLLELAYQILL